MPFELLNDKLIDETTSSARKFELSLSDEDSDGVLEDSDSAQVLIIDDQQFNVFAL